MANWIKLKKGKYDWMYSNQHTDFELLQKFIDENGFVSVTNGRAGTTFKWYLQHGKDVGRYDLDDHPPGDDHGYFFKYPSGECVYAYHPYADIAELAPQVKRWADGLKVKAAVYSGAYSWYYPNESLLVVVSLPDRNIKVREGLWEIK